MTVLVSLRSVKRCVTLVGLRRHRYLYLISLTVVFLFFYLTLFLNLDVNESTVVNQNDWIKESLLPANLNQSEASLEKISATGNRNKPIVWIYGGRHKLDIFRNVQYVFERLGYEVVLTGTLDSGTPPPLNWRVLWSHDHPFSTLSHYINDLNPLQRVNHIPGTGFFTNKAALVLMDVSFVPKAFSLPRDRKALSKYAEEHPDKLWVQKSNNHRGVKLISSVQDIKLERVDRFIQEYVDNPLLIDGRRFDIGLYVTITSINPLRVYINQGDWLVRFCPKEYHPFNISDSGKYVISDNYTPIWEMKSFRRLFNEMEYSRRSALFAYLHSIGEDGELLNRKLEEAVREVLIIKEPELIEALKEYHPRNFFEMVRFDFVIDKEMNIYLMEVNMSPNLSSGHFPRNRLMFQQIMLGLLSLVGLSRDVTEDHRNVNKALDELYVSGRDVRVQAEICSSSLCIDQCYKQECLLCKECLSAEFESILYTAYTEHINRRCWRRVVPQPFSSRQMAVRFNMTSVDDIQKMSAVNRKMLLWFRAKCIEDVTWCQ